MLVAWVKNEFLFDGRIRKEKSVDTRDLRFDFKSIL